VLGSIQAGNDWALGWIEDRAVGRVDGQAGPAGGLDGGVVPAPHLPGARPVPAPPQRRHQHRPLPDGTHRACGHAACTQNAQAASALATAEMRHQLTTAARCAVAAGRKSGWEIDGIDQHGRPEFSKRRNEIDDALQELEAEIGRGRAPQRGRTHRAAHPPSQEPHPRR
jgi:hypothetical protein